MALRDLHLSHHPFGISPACLASSRILGQPQTRTTYLNPASYITDSVTPGKGLRHAESQPCPSGMLKISIQKGVCHKLPYYASFPSPAPKGTERPSTFQTNTYFLFKRFILVCVCMCVCVWTPIGMIVNAPKARRGYYMP